MHISLFFDCFTESSVFVLRTTPDTAALLHYGIIATIVSAVEIMTFALILHYSSLSYTVYEKSKILSLLDFTKRICECFNLY